VLPEVCGQMLQVLVILAFSVRLRRMQGVQYCETPAASAFSGRYLSPAFTFSSSAAPGHSAASASWFSGVALVLSAWCRSVALGST
jgi:hypothetical protein